MLDSFIRETYQRVRKNPNKIEDIILELKSLDDEFKRQKNHRVISFLALKNDLILQNELTKVNVDNYFSDLKFCIENRLYNLEKGEETPLFKIFEILAKIQYAYNLLEVDVSLRGIYELLLVEFNDNFQYYFKFFKDRGINYHNYQLSFIYDIYFLFLSEYEDGTFKFGATMERLEKHDVFRSILLNVFLRLKEYKMDYYNLSVDDILKEGFTDYNFIY